MGKYKSYETQLELIREVERCIVSLSINDFVANARDAIKPVFFSNESDLVDDFTGIFDGYQELSQARKFLYQAQFFSVISATMIRGDRGDWVTDDALRIVGIIETRLETAINNKEKGKQSICKDEIVDTNLQGFWKCKGDKILEQYTQIEDLPPGNPLDPPVGRPLSVDRLHQKLELCEFVILTANKIEGARVARWLCNHYGIKEPNKIIHDNQWYQFYQIEGHNVVHILPQETSSFSEHGSANALYNALERFSPKAVFSVGVAFGWDPSTQEIGDILVSDRLIRYDAFNKRTNGKLTITDKDYKYVGDAILAGCRHYLSNCRYPNENNIGDFKWYLGTLLTGGTVLSDPEEKERLSNAIGCGKNVIGGEMEGSGVWLECDRRKIPFLIIKGICDWGINKNGWQFVTPIIEKQDHIKDCVQAYACDNACTALNFIMSQVYGRGESEDQLKKKQ